MKEMGLRRWLGGKSTWYESIGLVLWASVIWVHLWFGDGGWEGRHSVSADSWPRYPGEHSQKADKVSQTIDVKRLAPDGRPLTSLCTVWHLCHSQARSHGPTMHRREKGVLLAPITFPIWSCQDRNCIMCKGFSALVVLAKKWEVALRFSFARSGHCYNTVTIDTVTA